MTTEMTVMIRPQNDSMGTHNSTLSASLLL